MTSEEYKSAIMNTVYLSACAVNGVKPDAERVKCIDLHHLFSAAEFHQLTAITAMALESAGIRDQAFTQACGKAIRKNVIFDMERSAVLKKMDEAGIWYMPLKGCVVKDLYPKTGMRQMADNDILFDPDRRGDLRRIMESLGFQHETDGPTHDCYYKPPVCNFEMHHVLFARMQDEQICDYYENVKERLIKDEDNTAGFHFSDEDFYLYMIAHEYKHYSSAGTGLRSLLDTFVYCMKKDNVLDRDYIDRELEKTGLSDFEARNRRLAFHLFGRETDSVLSKAGDLTEEDREMLEYIWSSGTYGTPVHMYRKRIEKYGTGRGAKVRYLFDRLFMPWEDVKLYYPKVAKCPVLLPFLPFFRVFRGILFRRKKLKTELSVLAEKKKK